MNVTTSTSTAGQHTEAETTLESSILEIWALVFDVEGPSPDDDFFEMGGDSIIAELFAMKIQEKFGVDFKPSQFVNCDTPRKIAAAIGGETSRAEVPSNVIAINEDSDLEPLFVIHGGTGFIFITSDYIAALGQRRPVYIFQAPGFDGQNEALHRIEDLACLYVRTMLEISPNGPWNLLSFCAGGWIIGEIVRLMRLEGISADRIIIADIPIAPALRSDNRFSDDWPARINIPVISSAYVSSMRKLSDFSKKFKFLLRTGHFVDGDDSRAMAQPYMEEYLVRRMMRRNKLRSTKHLASLAKRSKDGTVLDKKHDKWVLSLMQDYSSELSARVSVRLRRALMDYKPVVMDLPVYVVMNRRQAQTLREKNNPFDKYLPVRRNVFVFDYARSSLGLLETARLIGRILDAPPDQVVEM